MLGRMGLSGDIYDLNDRQNELLDGAIAFYREVAPIIKDGKTTVNVADTVSYNKPTGSQLVLRELGDRVLCVYHRFEDSKPLMAFATEQGVNLSDFREMKRFGEAKTDFSAEAILFCTEK